ncbi:helix-turn-helix transcriptional regulator [Serratia fonticola]|uniref:helix-turn-helix transcriptional regulator n=1 Tax=Serratia fonticola TaxID=47917 RepID=UPI000586AA85|nr:YafY family protein [Serratia fonticola]MEB7883783.1 YafY family transcriptional regulator [Serratia fonticola]
MRAIRLFSILNELRSRRLPVSAETLAAIFNVSIRTIYRDMVTLQAMGAPINGESRLGFQIENETFLPPLHFSADELDAILIGMRMIQSRADSQLSDAAYRALNKIGSVLPQYHEHLFLDSPFMVHSSKIDNQVLEGGILSELCEVARIKECIEIKYMDVNSKKSNRYVRPLGVTCFNSVWLFTAWCDLRDDFRNFRVERIQSISRTGEKFNDKPGKSFKDYLALLHKSNF